ncbi:MAG: glycosyltransferase [Bacteroidetes bacterium]|nr:MAG: glycosyltransferase [Bacteroidota bacterium]
MISIIIPTLNEALCIGKTLTHLSNSDGDFEIIVVDGGSTDGTDVICRRFPDVRYVQMQSAQRARQMNRGAREASGDTLLFLHADTLPPSEYINHIYDALSGNKVIGGAFSIKFDANHWLLTVISRMTRLNIAWLTFGDHGIFLRKTDFLHLNGFTEIPILEDLEFQLRLKKHGVLVRPNASVRTSARRFINNGVIRQTLRDFGILMGYFVGVSPIRLARYYSNDVVSAR